MNKWFYMSFAGDEGWRGALHVMAEDEEQAVSKAWAVGKNPGGSILICPCPEGFVPAAECQYNLITDRAELEKICGPLESA